MFDAVMTACLVIGFILVSWAVAVGVGKIGELIFIHLVFPIHITWPLWILVLVFLGIIYYDKK